MKRLIKFGSIGLVILGAIASGVEQASAIPSTFRQRTDTGYGLGISGVPSSIKTLTFTGASVTKTSNIRINACGFGKITNPSAFTEGNISISGNGSFDVATVKANSAIAEPTCSSTGVAANLPATAGAYNVGKGAIVVTGLPVSRVLDISYTSSDPITKKVTMNVCGYGVTQFIPNSLVSIDGATPLDVSNEPIAKYACSSGILTAVIFTGSSLPLVPIASIPSISRDSANNLIVKSTPSTKVSLAFDGATFTKSVTSDRCSGLYLPATTTGVIKVSGISIDTSTFPSRSSQETCTYKPDAGGYYNSQGYNNSRYSDGRIYIKSFSGLTLGDRSIVSLETTGVRTVSPTTNACGLSVIRNASSSPITDTTSFTYNGSPLTVGSLPVLAALPNCNASTGLMSVPTN